MVKTRRRKTVKNRTMKKQIKNRQLRKRRTKKRGGMFTNESKLYELIKQIYVASQESKNSQETPILKDIEYNQGEYKQCKKIIDNFITKLLSEKLEKSKRTDFLFIFFIIIYYNHPNYKLTYQDDDIGNLKKGVNNVLQNFVKEKNDTDFDDLPNLNKFINIAINKSDNLFSLIKNEHINEFEDEFRPGQKKDGVYVSFKDGEKLLTLSLTQQIYRTGIRNPLNPTWYFDGNNELKKLKIYFDLSKLKGIEDDAKRINNRTIAHISSNEKYKMFVKFYQFFIYQIKESLEIKV
tara:strand:+ start:226 stop:1104 length:879 start_codon:yes stop_codon:yes gene_type:complete